MSEKVTNLDRARAAASKEQVKEWCSLGGRNSGIARAAKASLAAKLQKIAESQDAQDLMKTVLFGDLTEAERAEVRKIIPASVDDAQITPLVAMVYSTISKTIKTGDAASLERLLRVSGETPEIKIKLGNEGNKPFMTLDLGSMTDAELRRVMERERPAKKVIDIIPDQWEETDDN